MKWRQMVKDEMYRLQHLGVDPLHHSPLGGGDGYGIWTRAWLKGNGGAR